MKKDEINGTHHTQAHRRVEAHSWMVTQLNGKRVHTNTLIHSHTSPRRHLHPSDDVRLVRHSNICLGVHRQTSVGCEHALATSAADLWTPWKHECSTVVCECTQMSDACIVHMIASAVAAQRASLAHSPFSAHAPAPPGTMISARPPMMMNGMAMDHACDDLSLVDAGTNVRAVCSVGIVHTFTCNAG